MPPAPSGPGSWLWSGGAPTRCGPPSIPRPALDLWSRRSASAPGTQCCRPAWPAGPRRARAWSCPARGTLLTAGVPDAAGYGRVVRERGRPVGIVEHRDATAAQRTIREIGTSVYCFDAARFWPALAQVTPANEQHEYYLTDVI